MAIRNGFEIKAKEKHCHHFIDRVKERYGVDITESEYEGLSNSFTGRYKKGNYRTIGFVFYKGIKIWALYLNQKKCLATAYPDIIETDVIELMRACFPTPIRPLAYYVHEKYLDEKKYVDKLIFSSKKEAAKYYFSKTMFPSLHMDNYAYSQVNLFKLVHKIEDVIFNKSDYAQLAISKK